MCVRERRRRRRKVPGQSQSGPRHQRVDERGLPVAPCARAGRRGIGVGQRPQQLQRLHALHGGGHALGRERIIEVPARGGLGQQQVVAHQQHQDGAIGFVEAHARRDDIREVSADLAVIPGSRLADVMQKRSHEQQIRACDVAQMVS